MLLRKQGICPYFTVSAYEQESRKKINKIFFYSYLRVKLSLAARCLSINNVRFIDWCMFCILLELSCTEHIYFWSSPPALHYFHLCAAASRDKYTLVILSGSDLPKQAQRRDWEGLLLNCCLRIQGASTELCRTEESSRLHISAAVNCLPWNHNAHSGQDCSDGGLYWPTPKQPLNSLSVKVTKTIKYVMIGLLFGLTQSQTPYTCCSEHRNLFHSNSSSGLVGAR